MNRTTTKHQPSKRFVIPTAAEEPSFQSPNHHARPHSNSKQLPSATLPIPHPHRTPMSSPQDRLGGKLLLRPPRHFATSQVTDTTDLSAPLLRDSCRFLNAQGINTSLAQLYALLAAGRISPRRATALAYIGSLLLHSLTAIDKDSNPGAGRDLQPGEEYPILRSAGNPPCEFDVTVYSTSDGTPNGPANPTPQPEAPPAASPENSAPPARPETISPLAASQAVAPDPSPPSGCPRSGRPRSGRPRSGCH